jgi:hypothetical protein
VKRTFTFELSNMLGTLGIGAAVTRRPLCRSNGVLGSRQGNVPLSLGCVNATLVAMAPLRRGTFIVQYHR